MISNFDKDDENWVNEKRMMEALIFHSAKGITFQQLEAKISPQVRSLQKLLKELIQEYQESSSVLEIYFDGAKYYFQVKSNYSREPIIERFAAGSSFDPIQIKTLAYIAYNQPVDKQDIKDFIGRGAQKALRHLTHENYLSYKIEKLDVLNEKGESIMMKSYIYQTTPKFGEYFNLPNNNVKIIRERMEVYL